MLVAALGRSWPTRQVRRTRSVGPADLRSAWRAEENDGRAGERWFPRTVNSRGFAAVLSAYFPSPAPMYPQAQGPAAGGWGGFYGMPHAQAVNGFTMGPICFSAQAAAYAPPQHQAAYAAAFSGMSGCFSCVDCFAAQAPPQHHPTAYAAAFSGMSGCFSCPNCFAAQAPPQHHPTAYAAAFSGMSGCFSCPNCFAAQAPPQHHVPYAVAFSGMSGCFTCGMPGC